MSPPLALSLRNQKYIFRSTKTPLSWGVPRLKSGALQRQILKSLKMMPWHHFKAPGSNILKSLKSRGDPIRAQILKRWLWRRFNVSKAYALQMLECVNSYWILLQARCMIGFFSK